MLAPWKKSYDQPSRMLKSRDITLLTKVHLVRAMVFPVVKYGCESWTIKKAEHRRIDAFELWCWRRLLRVPWTAKRSNQSILNEISLEYSLEGLMQKLKFQYFGHLMAKNWLTGKDPDVGKDWRWEEKGTMENEMVGWHHWFDGPELIKLWELVMDREAWHAAIYGVSKTQTWLSDWTELNFKMLAYPSHFFKTLWGPILRHSQAKQGQGPQMMEGSQFTIARLSCWNHGLHSTACFFPLRLKHNRIIRNSMWHFF